MDFVLDSQKSRLELTLFSPFGTRAGRLSLSPSSAFWTDGKSVIDVQDHELFGKWYRPHWWGEVAFMMGLISPDMLSLTQVDEKNRPRALELPDRRLYCDYSKSSTQKNCKIDMIDFYGEINFQAVECKLPYETEAGRNSYRGE